MVPFNSSLLIVVFLAIVGSFILLLNLNLIHSTTATTASSTSSSGNKMIKPSSAAGVQQQWNDELLALESTVLSASTVKHSLRYNRDAVAYKDAMNLLKLGNQKLIDLIKGSITNFESKEVFFECPPVTLESFDRVSFEYVLISAPPLKDVSSDPKPFRSHFETSSATSDTSISFYNLGKDAKLIVPLPQSSDNSAYTHLSKFVHNAPPHQVDRFFQILGQNFEDLILNSAPTKKIWLSTSGLGVYWLHVRIDSVPKYYNYMPYKLG